MLEHRQLTQKAATEGHCFLFSLVMTSNVDQQLRSEADQLEIESLQARLSVLLGTTDTSQVVGSGDKLSGSHHGIGASLSPEGHETFDKWKKQFVKDMKGCTSVMFDGTAWLTWKKIVLLDLEPTGMLHVLEIQASGESALQHKKTVFADIYFQRYLMGRLTDKPRRAVTVCASSCEIWQKLKGLYASSTVTMQNTLKDEWEQLVQKPDQTVQDYIQSIDYLAMSMEAATVTQDDQSKYHRLMKGLGPQWSAQKEILDTTRSNYQNACQILIELGETRGERPDGQIVPAYAVDIRRSAQRTQRPSPGGKSMIMCYTCGSKDHTQDHCPSGLKPSYDSYGNQIDRCFRCLVEGHKSRQCPTRNSKGKSGVDTK